MNTILAMLYYPEKKAVSSISFSRETIFEGLWARVRDTAFPTWKVTLFLYFNQNI
jgi:hypothetical protein